MTRRSRRNEVPMMPAPVVHKYRYLDLISSLVSLELQLPLEESLWARVVLIRAGIYD